MMYDGELKLTVITDLDPGKFSTMIFIRHTEAAQQFPGINARTHAAAQTLGYTEQIERTVHDNQGRPIFEIFRFVRTRKHPAVAR